MNMPELHTFILFLVAASAAIAAPGPDILYVLSRAISGGKRTGCVSALAIASGEVLHTLLAVLGLATLLQTSAKAFLVVKLVGAFYLVYLGIKLMLKPNPFAAVQPLKRVPDWPVFRQGVLTNLFNPKAILFYVTFLPQFVNPRSDHALFQLGMLGIIFAVMDVVFLTVLALAAGRVNAWLTRNPRNARRVSVISGSLLVGLGLRLALAERD